MEITDDYITCPEILLANCLHDEMPVLETIADKLSRNKEVRRDRAKYM